MNIDKFSIRNKILLVIGVASVLMVVISTIVYINVRKLQESSAWVQYTQNIVTQGHRLDESMIDMETGLRGFQLTGKKEFLKPYVEGRGKFESIIAKAKQMVSDNPSQVAILEEIHIKSRKWQEDYSTMMIKNREQVNMGFATIAKFEAMQRSIEGRQIFDGIRQAITQMDNEFKRKNIQAGRFLLQSVLLDLVNTETGQRGFLLTGKEASLEHYYKGLKSFRRHSSEMKDFVRNNKGNVTLKDIEKIETLVQDWLEKAGDPKIIARRAVNEVPATLNDMVLLIEKGTGKRIMDEIREKMNVFINVEGELIKVRQEESDAAALFTQMAIIICTILALLIGLLSTFYISRRISEPMIELVEIFEDMSKGNLNKEVAIRGTDEIGQLGIAFNKMVFNLKQKVQLATRIANGDLSIEVILDSDIDELGKSFRGMITNWNRIVGEIRDGSMRLTTSTNQISAAATEQSRNIIQQNDALTNFSTGLNELSATSAEMGRSADNVVETSHKSIDLASVGNNAIGTSLKSIGEIQETNEGTSEKFTILVNKVENIAKVMGTITRIADKTNLLSVNASIEAVKAGEFGKGFSVVASEIRHLADQTVTATDEIKEFINDIQSAANAAMMSMEKSSATTKEGTKLVTEAGESIKNLIEAVQRTGPMLDEMRTAIKQQMEGTQQMTEIIGQIQQAANENKITTDQTTETTFNLSEMAQKQLEIVQQFKLNDKREDL